MNPALPVAATNDTAVTAAPVAVSSPVQRAVTREVSKAVQLLNDANYSGAGTEITFAIDRATRLPVVKIVDTNTKEVLNQWPAQYVLQLAADYVRSTQDSR